MSDFDERVTAERWDAANRAMLELSMRLAREFGVQAHIQEAADREGVTLTPAAWLILTAPLVEAAAAQQYRHSFNTFAPGVDVSMDDVRESLNTIVSAAREDAAPQDRSGPPLVGQDKQQPEVRSSLSIVRALAKRFCRIPPFCAQ